MIWPPLSSVRRWWPTLRFRRRPTTQSRGVRTLADAENIDD